MVKITVPSSVSSWPTCWNSKHSFLIKWECFKCSHYFWVLVKYVWRLIWENNEVIAWVVRWLRSTVLRLKSDCSIPWRFKSISLFVHETKESKPCCTSVKLMRSIYFGETNSTDPIIRIPYGVVPVLTLSDDLKFDVTDSTVVRFWGDLDKLICWLIKSPTEVWS